MHSALLIIEKPTTLKPQEEGAWRGLLQECKSFAQREGHADLLGEGVFLLDLAGGLGTLSSLVMRIDSERFPHRVLFFDHAPAWVMSKR